MSVIEYCFIRSRQVAIKRDDLLSNSYPGNKWRKLHSVLLELESSTSKYAELVGFGGSQGNMMLALAKLAHNFNLEFHYYTHSSTSQLSRVGGNFAVCLCFCCCWSNGRKLSLLA
jgi:1-aminocyclopropane-1-carboxylate deaminase/D-cysteine desulfhydrase-like pyridoxal-dependent ACC family enzyme